MKQPLVKSFCIYSCVGYYTFASYCCQICCVSLVLSIQELSLQTGKQFPLIVYTVGLETSLEQFSLLQTVAHNVNVSSDSRLNLYPTRDVNSHSKNYDDRTKVNCSCQSSTNNNRISRQMQSLNFYKEV